MRLPKFLQFRRTNKKSCDIAQYPHYYPLIAGLHDRLVHTGNFDLAAHLASNYYMQVQPLYDAIERIATALSSIQPKIWNKDKDQWEDNEVLELLEMPDDDTTWSEFFSNSGRWLMLTGNTEWLAGGNVNAKPIDIRVVHPQHVTAQRFDKDPYPSMYQVNEPWGGSTFNRFSKTRDRQFRFYRSDKQLELYHVKIFNPLSGSLFGLSPLNSIYYEIEQYKALSIHNLSLMKNGARAGLVIKAEGQLSQEQEDKLRAEIDSMYSGEVNANRPMLIPSCLDAMDLGKNNKEMDYVKLRKSILDGIYSTFRIPLPMVSADRMTLSNYAVSQLMLYDHTVEHYANRIFEELTRFLMPRYGDTEGNLSITYDNREISALETRRNEQVKLLKDIGMLSPNELRVELGFDEKPEKKADSVFIPQNLVPITDDEEEIEKPTEQPEEMPETEEEVKPEEEKSYIKQFKQILKTYKKANGEIMFEDKEIEDLANSIEKE